MPLRQTRSAAHILIADAAPIKPESSVCDARYSEAVTAARVTKADQRGARSRELLLDAAERLMAEEGYAANSSPAPLTYGRCTPT
jgi:hypothetical protein